MLCFRISDPRCSNAYPCKVSVLKCFVSLQLPPIYAIILCWKFIDSDRVRLAMLVIESWHSVDSCVVSNCFWANAVSTILFIMWISLLILASSCSELPRRLFFVLLQIPRSLAHWSEFPSGLLRKLPRNKTRTAHRPWHVVPG